MCRGGRLKGYEGGGSPGSLRSVFDVLWRPRCNGRLLWFLLERVTAEQVLSVSMWLHLQAATA